MTEKKGVKFFTVSQLAELVGAELIGDGSVEISGFGALKTAGAADISFINEEKYFNNTEHNNGFFSGSIDGFRR